MNTRYKKMKTMLEAGATIKEIRSEFNLSTYLVYRMLKDGEVCEKYGLNARAYHRLQDLVHKNFPSIPSAWSLSVDELKDVIVSHLVSGGYLFKPFGLGKKSLSEIEKLLGIPLKYVDREGCGYVIQKGDTNEYTG